MMKNKIKAIWNRSWSFVKIIWSKLFHRPLKGQTINIKLMERLTELAKEKRVRVYFGTHRNLQEVLKTTDMVFIVTADKHSKAKRKELEKWFYEYKT